MTTLAFITPGAMIRLRAGTKCTLVYILGEANFKRGGREFLGILSARCEAAGRERGLGFAEIAAKEIEIGLAFWFGQALPTLVSSSRFLPFMLAVKAESPGYRDLANDARHRDAIADMYYGE
jgi:hypothetical protein